MHRRTRFVFWVILLLVGLNLAIPDPPEVTPAPSQGSVIALIDSDDVDDPDHSHAFDILAHAHVTPLPSEFSLGGLALSERIEPSTPSATPTFLLLSLRTPRSPTAS